MMLTCGSGFQGGFSIIINRSDPFFSFPRTGCSEGQLDPIYNRSGKSGLARKVDNSRARSRRGKLGK